VGSRPGTPGEAVVGKARLGPRKSAGVGGVHGGAAPPDGKAVPCRGAGHDVVDHPGPGFSVIRPRRVAAAPVLAPSAP
jgi:hypothetical protein